MTEFKYNGWHKIEEIEAVVNGQTVKREKLHLLSAVGGIVTDTKGQIALVKQFRPTINQYTYEIPAGVLDKSVSKEQIMLEELQEECNIFEVSSIEPASIKGYFMVTGSSDAYMHLYRIQVPVQQATVIQDSEVEELLWVDFTAFEAMIHSGFIVDSKTLMAYTILLKEGV